MMRLHSDGFELIDLQSLETALTTVWLRKGGLRFDRTRENVAMVVWESNYEGDKTTMMTWRV